MTDASRDWKTSPNAAEFLPEEIEQLQLGTMALCEECLWPRPVDTMCPRCATYDADQDRNPFDSDSPDDFTDLP